MEIYKISTKTLIGSKFYRDKTECIIQFPHETKINNPYPIIYINIKI